MLTSIFVLANEIAFNSSNGFMIKCLIGSQKNEESKELNQQILRALLPPTILDKGLETNPQN